MSSTVSARNRTLSALVGALSMAAVLASARVLQRVPRSSLDLSRTPVSEVGGALRERLARLDSDLLLTYAASPEASMPSELRGVAVEVVSLLRSIEEAGGGRVRIQIVDPTSDPDLPGYLAGIGLAPFRARSLEIDSAVERSVWSSLRIAYGAHGAAAIRAVTPAVSRGLQALLVAHLDRLESPRRPRVALSAPPAFGALRRALRSRAELLECDFDKVPRIPEEADLFWWIDPESARAEHQAALRDFLERGRSAVVAGSALRAEFVRTGTAPAVRFARTPFPSEWLREFGLAPVEGIALEAGGQKASPLLRSIGSDQDFRALAGQPNGSLLFAAPTAFEPDGARLTDLGLSMSALASSSGITRVRPWQAEPILEADLAEAGAGARAPRLPLLALLSPDDPWRGSLVFAASSSPFSDEYLHQPAFAHEALLSILVASLASPERLAIESAAVRGAPGLPDLSRAQRNVLRAAITISMPLLFGLLGLARALGRSRTLRFPAGLILRAAALAAVALLVARFAPARLSLDLTREGLNGLAPEMRAILTSLVSEDRPARLEMVFSPDGDLPQPMRPCARRARELARTLAAAAPGLEVEHVRPSDAARLAREGVLPLDTVSAGTEAGARRQIFASMLLSARGRTEILSFPDPASFEHLEFRLASALERLTGGRKAKIAFASGAQRLSPAEALEYQRKGLFAPGEGDVFGEARVLLEAHDFAVTELDPQKPEPPEGTDVLVCLQPRRDAAPLIAAAARHLSRGGGVLLAAQHFAVRSRRTQASGLALALWPQPQFADVDRLYFPKIGIDLVREVLFDELHGDAEVATQVERGPGRFEVLRERAVSPLFVRAVPAGFDAASPVARGISELLLECPSRLRWDGALLAGEGISARPLFSTSERAWSLDWKGGDLPPEVLRGPPAGAYLGRQPLAALFEGRFPPPAIDPQLAAASKEGDEKGGTAAGRLLFLGCSEMFRDGELSAPGRDHAQLLLNSVAALALSPELAELLARRSAPQGLDLVRPRERILWRILVVGAGPTAVLLLGLWRTRRRARPAAV